MRTQASGWGVFGATMLLVLGAINIVQGLVALFQPAYYAVVGGEMLLFGFTPWGWIVGVWGIVLVLAGLALLSGRTWARAIAVVLAAANIIAQLGFLMAHPIWSAMAMAMNVAVVYALTAGWPDAPRGREAERESEAAAYQAGQADARGAPAPAEEPGMRGEPSAHQGEQQPRTGYGKHEQRT